MLRGPPFMTLWAVVVSCGPATHQPSFSKGLRGSVRSGEETGLWSLVQSPAVPLTSCVMGHATSLLCALVSVGNDDSRVYFMVLGGCKELKIWLLLEFCLMYRIICY